MQTEFIKISKIVHNTGQIDGLPKNPRKKNEDLFNKLVKSIEEDPEMMELRELLVYPHNGKYVCIAGNMRLDALKHLGLLDAPCKVIPAETPVEKLKAYTIKDNASFGEWDIDMLTAEWDLSQLEDWGVNIDVPDVDILDEEEVHEDEFDESEVQESIVQPLDVWQLGEHRLMCGDSTSANDVAVLMDGAKADLLITDPPYNVDYVGKTKDALKIKNDKMDNDNFRLFLRDAFSAGDSVLKEGGVFYIWHADSEGYNFRGACDDVNWKVKQCLIWNKNSLVMGRQDYQWKHEPCLYGWKEGAGHYFTESRKETTVLDFDRPTRSELHPTMKPIELFAYQIGNSSRKGEVVLDLFGGSGTTLIACEQMGRKARLMELDPHYCDVIIARWYKLTGQKAVKL